jgi:hypothetical protein
MKINYLRSERPMRISFIARTILLAAVAMAGLTKTAAAVPQVIPTYASAITSNSAMLHGLVNPGGQPTTACFSFAGIFSSVTNLPGSNSFLAVDLPVTRTIPSRYAFDLRATNVSGYSNSAAVFFAMETLPFTDSARSITTTSANLDGIVEQGSLQVQVYFQWGLTTNYGNFSATNTLSTDLGARDVSITISNLVASTKYHYRIVSSTSAGTNYGKDVMFLSLTPSAGTWIPLANNPPGDVQSSALLSDGSVLANFSSSNWFKLTPDSRGSYTYGTWSNVAPMHYTRSTFSSAVMRDGRLLVPGGEYGTGTNTAEVYDPVSNIWTVTQPVDSISAAIFDAAVSMLPDGRVLVGIVWPNIPNNQNGYPIIYDPLTNGWTKAGNYAHGLYDVDEATWVKLPDDSILEVDFGTKHSQRYIPSLDQWIPDADTPADLYALSETGPALMLPNGNAFFIGGSGHTAIYKPSGNTGSGAFIAGPDIPNAMGAMDAPAAMMVNGKILCAVTRLSSEYGQPSNFYEYDYLSNSFALVTAPGGITELNGFNSYYDASGTVMLDLPEGSVLFTKADTVPWIYRPLAPPLAAGKPKILSITTNGNGTLHLTGNLFNGLSTGSSYGDDAGNDNNYPLVRFTGSNGIVRYGRTSNWSSTGVQTGTNVVSTDCTVPTGASPQDFIEVVANGISSAATPSLLVTNTSDGGPGSLRRAIVGAYNGATINFAPGLSGQTILLTNGQISLDKSLTIDASTLPGGIRMDGNHSSRIFNVPQGASLTLNSVTLTNGYGNTNLGGAILNYGSVTLSNCTLCGNSMNLASTGVAGYGGAIFSYGNLALGSCTISGNSAVKAGAIYNTGTCAIENSTFAGNSASSGVVYNEGLMTLTHSTVSGNAGIPGNAFGNLGFLAITNTIIAGNPHGDIFNFSGSTVSAGGANIVQSITGGTIIGPASIIQADPMLAPLGNYGGSTLTMPPMPGSPAIDSGSDSAAAGLVTDQRGRPRLAGAHVDIGAVELQTPTSVVTTTADSGVGSLRNILALADVSTRVIFTPGLSGQTIPLTSGQFALNKVLTIDASALPNGIRIDGNHASRIFSVTTAVVVTLNSLVLTNGYSTNLNTGGAIQNYGTLTLSNCTLSGNSVDASSSGGAIANYQTLTLDGCTLANNFAFEGGALFNYSATSLLRNCTCSGNVGKGAGGGLENRGGALTLIHCTVSSNTTLDPGATGGGVDNYFFGALNITNSIIAGNSTPGGAGADIYAYSLSTVAFGGANIVQSLFNNGGTVTGNQFNLAADPLLAQLGNYGGRTQTMPPLPGSPAIDAGSDTAATALTTDQRGLPRWRSTHVDIGAVELQTPISAVISTVDSGFGSLRNALTLADVSTIVTFAPGLSGQTILLTSGQIALNMGLVIDASALPNGIRVDGNHSSRIFNVSTGVVATLNSLVLTNGYPGPGIPGGAILNSGNLALANCTLAGNSAKFGGAIDSQGSLSMAGCTVNNNAAELLDGGGIFVAGGGGNLTNCTFFGNTAVVGKGGAICQSGGVLSLLQCTFSGNTADFGGGVYAGGASLSVKNSIIAGNNFRDVYNPGPGTVAFGGANIVQAVEGPFTGTIIDPNPLLGALANNGGPTRTMLPQLGSPAIDAGASSLAAAIPYDQRGPGYPRVQGTAVDIGAVETAYPPAAPIVATQPVTGLGLSSATLNATVTPNGAVTTAAFQWGTSTSYGNTTPSVVLSGANQPVSSGLTGLSPATLYHFRVVATNSAGTSLGNDLTFQTTLFPNLVYNTNDSGLGSFRNAITAATNGATITFVPELSGATILLTSGGFLLNSNVTIDASALPGGIRIDGNQATRIFTVLSGVSVTLNSLVLTNAYAGADISGGAIVNLGTLALNNCTLAGNLAGGNAVGGAIWNSGPLTLMSCTLAGNTAGIGGGAIYNYSNCVALNSTFAGNTASTGNGGAIDNSLGATLNLLQCTCAGNSAAGSGGGINNDSSQVNITNSIVAGNSATQAADIYNGSGSTVTAGGFNIVQSLTGLGTVNGAASVIVADPLLAPLANYGGLTQTMPPQTQSPAIDAGASSAAAGLSYDQRGPGYPRQVGGAVDIGAVEAAISLLVFTTADSGYGSLRYAVNYATGGSGITFAPVMSGQTITLTSGQIALDKTLTIDASTLANGVVVNGNHSSRIFNVPGGVSVTVNSVMLTNGYAGAGNSGGAIVNLGALTLNNCSLAGNSVDASAVGGAIYNNGPLTLIGCTVSGNNAGFGGAINNYSNCTLQSCTLSSNTASAANGGAIDNVFGATLNMLHCTISSNSAAAAGGGIDNYLSQVTIINTIVAGNSGDDIYNWTSSTVTSGGSNIVQTLNGPGTVVGSASIIAASALLAPLANYGGLTKTMPPQTQSPAIDAGDSSAAAGISFDQRGAGYPRLVGDAVDIGAVEAAINPYVFTTADSGYGSLRYAVNYATNGSGITFAPGLSGQTITLTTGDMLLGKNLTIDASALAGGVAINGNQASRIFYVASDAIVTLNSLTLSNGYVGPGNWGGAIANAGTLALNRCTVSGNSVDSSDYGGAIVNVNSLTLLNCTFSGNSGADGGGAIENYFSVICAATNCTFASNSSATYGGAIDNYGGTLSLAHCTLSRNTAAVGGALDSYAGSLTMINTIASANTGSSGADVYNAPDNTTTLGGANLVQDLLNDGGSLLGPLPLSSPSMLESLGNYGGPTQTMPPLPGSPAVDAGDDAAAIGLATDQRGLPRLSGDHVDIGAAELQLITSIAPAQISAMASLPDGSFQLSFTNQPGASFRVFAAPNVDLPWSNWTMIGFAAESPASSGQFQFTDSQATNNLQRFYRLRSP